MGFKEEEARKSFEAYVSQNSFDTDTDLTAQFEQILDRYSEIADVTQKYNEKVRNRENIVDYMNSAESKQWVKEHREVASEAGKIHREFRELFEEMELDVWSKGPVLGGEEDTGHRLKTLDQDAVADKLGEEVVVIISQSKLLKHAEMCIEDKNDSGDGIISKIGSVFYQ